MRFVPGSLLACIALAAALQAAEPQRIVFTRVFPNEGQIGMFVAARDGSDERPLLTARHMDYDPVWSPDGQSIVFTSDREGSADLFRVKPDGTSVERLTDRPAYDDQAAFSPDGKQLVLVSSRTNGRSNLWTLDIASRQMKQLTSGEGGDFRPSWSPDGRWIAWSELAVANGRAEAHVVVAAPDGSGRRESLIPFPPFYLSWDPTSSRVAFLGGEEPFTLGLVERRGDAGARPLAKGVPFYLSWGPTGDRMVTHVGSEGLDELGIDGETTDLGTTSLLQAPSWGPDGQIAFVRPAGGGGRGQLVALDERSGRIRRLADLEGAAYLVVSPDGSRVAFHGRDPEEQDFFDRGLPDVATDLGVHVASTDGSREVVATREPAMAWSWSPDGRRLAVLEPVYGDQIRFRWRIWSDEGSFTTPPFSGSITFLQEAAFFTQFA